MVLTNYSHVLKWGLHLQQMMYNFMNVGLPDQRLRFFRNWTLIQNFVETELEMELLEFLGSKVI